MINIYGEYFVLYVDRLLFQIFRRFFLRKVWLLNIVSHVSESRKLADPVVLLVSGLMTSLWRHQNVRNLFYCFQLTAKWSICFLEKLRKQHFQSKLITTWCHTIANEGLWHYQAMKTEFCSLRPRPRDENVLKQ